MSLGPNTVIPASAVLQGPITHLSYADAQSKNYWAVCVLSRLPPTSDFDASPSDIPCFATLHAHTHRFHDTEATYHHRYEHESVTANSRVAVQVLAYLDLLAVLQKLREIP